MTEREKMLAGELYDCGDKGLLTQWHKAKNLTRDYNNTDSESGRKRPHPQRTARRAGQKLMDYGSFLC